MARVDHAWAGQLVRDHPQTGSASLPAPGPQCSEPHTPWPARAGASRVAVKPDIGGEVGHGSMVNASLLGVSAKFVFTLPGQLGANFRSIAHIDQGALGHLVCKNLWSQRAVWVAAAARFG